MSQATGLLLQFVRCNAPARAGEWLRWLDEVHLPDLRASEGVRAATAWALRVQPEPGMPSVGFSHAILIELSGDLARSVDRIHAREDAWREAGRLDRNHCVMVEDRLRAHGRHANKPLPGPALLGHILAYVHCNDPRQEKEWDEWNDTVHMPDMLASDGFTGVSRWLREPRSERGANFVTLYDVGECGVEVAVARSAAVMPGLVASGRKHDCHVGGLTVTLVRPW